jgi:hypothetical protein
MNWTCRHCEKWTREGCVLGHLMFPNGSPDWCPDFYREPGSDDDLDLRAPMARETLV